MAIPVGLVGLAALPMLGVLVLYLLWASSIPSLIVVGRRLSRGRLSAEGAFLLSAVLMVLLLLIPYVRIVVGLGAIALGAGVKTKD